jgi:hypothetical protein
MLTAGPLEHATFDKMRALEAMHSEAMDSGATCAGQSVEVENTALRRRCLNGSEEAEPWPLRSAIALMSRDTASSGTSLGFDMPAAGLEEGLELLRWCMPKDASSTYLAAFRCSESRRSMIRRCIIVAGVNAFETLNLQKQPRGQQAASRAFWFGQNFEAM